LTLTVVRPSAIGIGAASAEAARDIMTLGIGSGSPGPESLTDTLRTVQLR